MRCRSPIRSPALRVDAWLFVAALSFSAYAYVEAFTDMTLGSWIDAHVHALEAFGGTARLLVPDNLRTGVSRSDRYEPALNPAYARMAEHYGTAIVRPGSEGLVTSRSWRAVSGSWPTRSPRCCVIAGSWAWRS